VDFVRQLEDIDKEISVLALKHPEVFEGFEDIIGGSYRVLRNKGLYFVPRGARKPRLSMTESSSAVRALLDVGFYLKCKAAPGDLLMIDEPELNLHPVNQRRLARLLAKLVNCGIKVFITTHSDYIVKEFNTLIMLNTNTDAVKAIQKKFHYSDDEILDPARVKLYMTSTEIEKRKGKGNRRKINTMKTAKVHPDQGIEVSTFDTSIDAMNEIQTEILFSEEK
jgi:hypothetical protein